MFEGAAPGGGSLLLTGRRTYYDLVAGLVTDQNLPAFVDLQVQANWTVGPGYRLSLFGLTSRENADFQFDPEDDEESGDTRGLVSEASNDLGSLRFDALLGGRATSRTIVSWYRNTELLAVDATFEASSRRSNLDLIESAAWLIRKVPGARIVIAGDGPLRPAVAARRSALKLDSHVILTGLRRDVPDLLGAADVLAIASLWEGLPRVIPQAMAAGLPIAATAIDGNTEVVVNGETGILVAPGTRPRSPVLSLRSCPTQRVPPQWGKPDVLELTSSTYTAWWTTSRHCTQDASGPEVSNGLTSEPILRQHRHHEKQAGVRSADLDSPR